MLKRKKFKFTSEAQLALPLVEWLTGQGWEVYKEVSPRRLNSVADIVAVKEGKIWVIETKLVYGAKVLEQAYNWKQYADFVSVAVPRTDGSSIVFDFFAKEKGIGIFWVSSMSLDTFYVHLNQNPKLNEKIRREVITESLKVEQKDSIAGSAGGGYVTDYSLTVERIRKLLREKGPLTIQNIVDSIEHHYVSRASAIQALKKNLFKYEVDFEIVRDFDKEKIKLKDSGSGK